MSACLGAEITLHAGGGWTGHTFFRVKHPITQKSLHTNSIQAVISFCAEHNLFFDREFVSKVTDKLDWNSKYGYLVPDRELDKNLIVTSAQKYLNRIQSE